MSQLIRLRELDSVASLNSVQDMIVSQLSARYDDGGITIRVILPGDEMSLFRRNIVRLRSRPAMRSLDDGQLAQRCRSWIWNESSAFAPADIFMPGEAENNFERLSFNTTRQINTSLRPGSGDGRWVYDEPFFVYPRAIPQDDNNPLSSHGDWPSASFYPESEICWYFDLLFQVFVKTTVKGKFFNRLESSVEDGLSNARCELRRYCLRV